MVFQNYALYPYLTVEANIAFPLRIAKVKKAERLKRAREVANKLGLAHLLDQKPGQLSGGERQRVAMGRAIIRLPKVFLMDEPLSNLDAKLLVQMRADVAALQSEFAITTVYVTHDQAEAMTLGHRVAVLHEGQLQQVGAPRELYERPVNTFVAGFIGSPAMNLCTVPLGMNGAVSFGGAQVHVPAGQDGRPSSSACARSRWRSRPTACLPMSRSSRRSARTRSSSALPRSAARRRSSWRGRLPSSPQSAASASRCVRRATRRTSSIPSRANA
jgi:multiple sugar transport system ATP-binding protein